MSKKFRITFLRLIYFFSKPPLRLPSRMEASFIFCPLQYFSFSYFCNRIRKRK
nr:MAG TPA: hypothetical protein [Caudoviricetes sp.]